jgi:predicted Fe-Mo cluster-binding NifX family protein
MMRLVVISEGESLDSEVAEDFGHAPFFLVVDSDTLDYHVIENEFADSPEGAGIAVAKAITTLQPDAVLTGGIGMHGIEILRKAGIFVSYDEEGPIEQCITDFVRRHRNNAS